MIRVNLLPTRRGKRREASQRQILYMALGVLLTVGASVFVHLTKASELEAVLRQNRNLQADIDRLKTELGDYDKIKAQREELLRQRQSIKALEAGRAGPVYLLREISEILTPGKGPTFDRVAYEETLRRDPNAGFNASWDPRRLWIDSYDEKAKKVQIRGSAKSNEDAAEFMKRLGLSVFFADVVLDGTQQVGAQAARAGSGVKHITFNMNARVQY